MFKKEVIVIDTSFEIPPVLRGIVPPPLPESALLDTRNYFFIQTVGETGNTPCQRCHPCFQENA